MDDPGLASAAGQEARLALRAGALRPLTDGRSGSRVSPSIFFPGFDVTPLGGVSLGRFGWEAGERIAESLAPGGASR